MSGFILTSLFVCGPFFFFFFLFVLSAAIVSPQSPHAAVSAPPAFARLPSDEGCTALAKM